MVKVFNFEGSNIFSSNVYIVGKENGPCVVIDIGYLSKGIIEYIKTHHTEIKAIILTHGHFDHIAGLNDFMKSFGETKVYIDRFDLELVTNPKLNCSRFGRTIVTYNGEVIDFKDGDTLDFGDDLVFKIYETPFHTEGSVCILNKSENALFTGDSLFKGSIGRYDLITSDHSKLKNSLDIIKCFDNKLVVYPGHGEITTIEEELKNNLYLK